MYTKTKSRHGRSNSVRRGRRVKFKGGRPQGRGGKTNHNNRRRRGGRKMPTFDPSQFINTNPVDVVQSVYTPKNSFKTFGLNARLVETITSLNMKSPTPIQDQIIPEILSGRDVIGLAETGTGKTAAFLIPLIEKNIKDPKRQTLILAPTRELALQIEEELRTLARGLRLSSVVCVGGINIRPQIKALYRTNQFIVGTPGRILDLLKRKHFVPHGITTVILDEADRMLDMGFINDMKTILSAVPKNSNW